MTTDDGIICPDCEDDLLIPKDNLNLIQCPACRRCYTIPHPPKEGRTNR
jgi:uncharacterized protein YbaR (Trm112 family)